MYFWCWQRSTTKGLWPLTIWKVRLSTVAAEEEGKEAEEEGKEGEQEHKRSLIKVYLHKNGISDACHMLHRRYHMWYFNWSSELSWSQCRPYWFHHFLFCILTRGTVQTTLSLSIQAKGLSASRNRQDGSCPSLSPFGFGYPLVINEVLGVQFYLL